VQKPAEQTLTSKRASRWRHPTASSRSPSPVRLQLGEIDGAPFRISGTQAQAWANTNILIDVVPGRGGMFSIDNDRERRLLVRSKFCLR
jgi:uncharacterized protein (DUF779 family)